jgi:tol-pal system beta propeller repeat protein TolB
MKNMKKVLPAPRFSFEVGNHMKFFGLLFSLLLCAPLHAEDSQSSPDFQISVQTKKTQKIPVGLVTVGHVDQALKQLCDRVRKDFEWSGQCKIVPAHLQTFDHTRQIGAMFPGEQVPSVALFLSGQHQGYSWRLYDLDSMTMIAGQSEHPADESLTYLAHTIADKVWPYLFGQSSCFRSKIAYCKQIWRKKYGKEKPYKQIWIADFDGSNPVIFVDVPTVSLAPRWSTDVQSPLLFYSENTMSNVQLVLSNMFGKRKVVCCFDGLNMQPTFSMDGNKMVFCLSKDGTSQLYLSYIDFGAKKRIFERVTHNEGRNIAPCFIGNDQVAYVSDFETSKPQLYILNLRTQTVERITDGGYCACPNYSPVRNQLVYSKMLGGTMQLFTYDLISKNHVQITHSAGSKEEGSWSSCGNYIVFGLNQGNLARICQLHLSTGKISFLTPADQHCTYPACSPVYEQCLGILNH